MREIHRKSVTGVNYTKSDLENKDLYETKYTEAEMAEIETVYMETESEARKRFQRQGSLRRRDLSDKRSTSRQGYGGSAPHLSKYDRFRYGTKERKLEM